MPGPTTEVLNEDIKEVKADIRDIRSSLNVLQADLHNVANGLAELRAEVRVSLGVAKWAGALLVTAVLTSGVAGIWWASGINAKVDALDARMDERFKASDARLDEKSKAIDALFDRLEVSITKVLEQVRTPQSAKAAAGTAIPEE